RPQHRVEQAGEALVQLVPAQRHHPLPAGRDVADHAGLPQRLEVMGERRLRRRRVDRLAVRDGLRPVPGDQPDQLQPGRVAEREQHLGQLDVGQVRVGQVTGCGGHNSSTSLELSVGAVAFRPFDTTRTVSESEPMMPALRPASHPGSTLRLPRAAAFWVVGGTVAALLAASSAPSPLYPIYQQEFRFSALELTAIFAVYVLAVLLSLLTVGRLSDFTGRRPVLAGALVVEAAAIAVFLTAEGTHWLLAAGSCRDSPPAPRSACSGPTCSTCSRPTDAGWARWSTAWRRPSDSASARSAPAC